MKYEDKNEQVEQIPKDECKNNKDVVLTSYIPYTEEMNGLSMDSAPGLWREWQRNLQF